ncbi:unnamed protein product [Bursaphelenchus xylophilus]|uniref:(pine wood nematode) hypothetical protein n=1 Tax=Bursaphelenchus xylophilus TaxID=6326 RepID=A0A1I7SPW4_BURXY|nr:unnamed protein product [Bursaphelenchus xylophilus]CAG9109294.1 unnamed protein product [Bursaphelenchus xylophilus]
MSTKLTVLCFFGIMAVAYSQIPGGFAEQDVNDPQIIALAQKSFSKFAATRNGNFEFVKVKSARSQVVAGINYEIEFIVKNGNKEECVKSTVFSQPWTQTEEHTLGSC